MTGNKVMKLWTVLVTAFMAVLAALGFATTATAATSVQQAKEARNCSAAPADARPAPVPWTSPKDRTLPPTMKQRIRAEAHGASPSCRPAAVPEEAAGSPAPADQDRARHAAADGTSGSATGGARAGDVSAVAESRQGAGHEAVSGSRDGAPHTTTTRYEADYGGRHYAATVTRSPYGVETEETSGTQASAATEGSEASGEAAVTPVQRGTVRPAARPVPRSGVTVVRGADAGPVLLEAAVGSGRPAS